MSINTYCQTVISARWFQPLVVAVILAAGGLVGLETYPHLSQRYGYWFRLLDRLIVAFFTVEILLKIGAQGRQPWRFFRDPWNVFDFAVVSVCLLPFGSHSATVLRLIRILRVLRLVTVLPRLQLLVGTLLKSLPSMGYVGLLLLLLFYVYAVMGTSLFGTADPAHFGSLQSSLMTLFQTVTLDGWTDIMKLQLPSSASYAPQGNSNGGSTGQARAIPFAAVAYFVSFILIGTMVLLNLFIGVIMSGMQETQREAALAERIKHRGSPGCSTVSGEIRILEHQLDQFMERLQEIRLQMEQPPARAEASRLPLVPLTDRPVHPICPGFHPQSSGQDWP